MTIYYWCDKLETWVPCTLDEFKIYHSDKSFCIV